MARDAQGRFVKSDFVPNPEFMPELERAVMKAMLDSQFETKDDVERNVSPPQVRKHVAVKMVPPSKTGREIRGRVYYGRGLGAIFDKGTVQRQLKGRGKYPAGTNRGAITTASHAMQRAKESALRRGLDLRRYL